MVTACPDPWVAAAFHIALQIQKSQHGTSGHKGNSFLVFDENKIKSDGLTELLWNPPDWVDSYCGQDVRSERMNQIIDTAFTVKSHHAGMVQVADLYAYIFRRFAETQEYEHLEAWPGEIQLLSGYVRSLSERLLPRSVRWPLRTGCDYARCYTECAPKVLRELTK